MSKISKLGVGIVAFEGTEHIKNIMYEIRPYVDYAVVCLQEYSYMGDHIDRFDIEECKRLKSIGLIDDIIWFKFDRKYLSKIKKPDDKNMAPRKLECDKRNFIMSHLQKNKCSHSLVIDSDEYYDGAEFRNAVNTINKSETHRVTYCQYLNYWRDYRHYLVWPFETFVPFICESDIRYSYDCKCFHMPIDPSRVYKINEGDSYSVFAWESIHMHHFSWIRIDIQKKIRSWSAGKYFSEAFLNRVVSKYNTWKEYENASIMFGSPNGEVCVHTFNKQYIHPRYRLDEII